MLVKTIRAKRARATALIKVSTRLTPDDDKKKAEEEHKKILVIVAEIQDTQTQNQYLLHTYDLMKAPGHSREQPLLSSETGA